MNASVIHFCDVVDRIEANTWWAAHFAPGKTHPEFTYHWTNDRDWITEVPAEPFESLLLNVRKLTMNDAPENLHKVRKALKADAKDYDQAVLDVWHKYWRLAFIKEPFEVNAGETKHVMTPYRVYDCFINGVLFHSNDPTYNVILHGSPQPPAVRKPHLFLRNIFHSTVVNLCFAAVGLKRYIDNGCTFMNFMTIPVNNLHAVEFIFYRNQIDKIDKQYGVFNDWVMTNGGAGVCRWS